MSSLAVVEDFNEVEDFGLGPVPSGDGAAVGPFEFGGLQKSSMAVLCSEPCTNTSRPRPSWSPGDPAARQAADTLQAAAGLTGSEKGGQAPGRRNWPPPISSSCTGALRTDCAPFSQIHPVAGVMTSQPTSPTSPETLRGSFTFEATGGRYADVDNRKPDERASGIRTPPFFRHKSPASSIVFLISARVASEPGTNGSRTSSVIIPLSASAALQGVGLVSTKRFLNSG
jgi:hypothetical protein